jgi:NAD(P)H-hydrate epimerase
MTSAAGITFTRALARAYDRHAMVVSRIPGIALMENAAAGCARIALGMVDANARPRVLVACGSGQNGGDGYGVARHLADAGCAVEIVFVGIPKEGTDAAVMRSRAEGITMRPFGDASASDGFDLVVDALFGTGLDRALAGDALACVRWINAQPAPVLSIDLPSGMDCDSGLPMPECVRATVTATMVAPKAGFELHGARACVGRVAVVPIGGPDPREFLAEQTG